MSRKYAYQFFLAHAGYSHDPKRETAMQGRIRCAKAMALAERNAWEGDYRYEWSVDPDSTSADWSDEKPAYAQWQCAMFDVDGTCVASLHGIDFGRDKEPWGDPYKRVVEAELALEAIDETDSVLQEQESNYNRMIGDSLRRY